MDQRIYRYFQGEMTAQEREALLRDALDNEALKKEMVAFTNVMTLSDLHSSTKDVEAGERSYAAFSRKMSQMTRRATVRQWLRYAAVFIVAVSATWMGSALYQRHMSDAIVQTMTVPEGQRAHITLPDGSSVWVNSGSTLTYPSVFSADRHVKLSGEALFDVVKGKKPFLVRVGGTEVKVLGTRFNVLGYEPNKLEVALLRGKVTVHGVGDQDHGVTLSPNQKAVLKAGIYHVESIEEGEDPTLWQQGIVSFENITLSDLVSKMESYYHLRIRICDPSLANTRYTGKFRDRDSAMDVLRLISGIHHFKLRQYPGTGDIDIYR